MVSPVVAIKEHANRVIVQQKNEEVDRLRSQIEIANKQTPANSPENNQVASIKNALGDIDYFRRAKKNNYF